MISTLEVLWGEGGWEQLEPGGTIPRLGRGLFGGGGLFWSTEYLGLHSALERRQGLPGARLRGLSCVGPTVLGSRRFFYPSYLGDPEITEAP